MATAEEMLQATDEVLSDGARRGMMHLSADGVDVDGRTVTVEGRKLINFGSCSYLGLERHPALVQAVQQAADQYGTQFSSSRAYISAPDYARAEAELTTVFGRPALINSSTTLGHISALPSVVGSRDALILDHQVHASVSLAARHAQAQGTSITLNPHNNMTALDRRVGEMARNHARVWYATDGLFSMYADYAPVDTLNELMHRHPQLWLYVDDAHSVSWSGPRGQGYVLPRLSPVAAARALVGGSLNKSFAAAGGVMTFPDDETRRKVFTVGGPLIFSGPVQPPMLAAILASARLHQTQEVADRQRRLLALIRLFNQLADEAGLPLISPSEAPIRCVATGVPSLVYDVAGRLRDSGYFVDPAVFPAVPPKLGGIRIALTAHHTDADVADVIEALADALPRALAAAGSSPTDLTRAFRKQLGDRPVRLRSVAATTTGVPAQRGHGLTVERHDSVSEVDPAEWDRLFAGRGAFATSGLRALERTFDGAPEPEHDWRFHYRIVRDGADAPIAATFFTTALWKEDMLSPATVSAEVEHGRQNDPYYLTSAAIAMGSLLTEGDHLYLDRRGAWRTAIRLILADMRAEEDRVGAAAVVLRDLPDGDDELHELLLAEGFLRVPIYPTWIKDLSTIDPGQHFDEQFLAGLPKKHRYHQRRLVLGWEHRFDTTVIRGGEDPSPPPGELDHLYRLYRAVHARNLELNVFPLPRRLLDAALSQPGWELVVLRLPELGDQPVAFALQHCGPNHIQPVLVGLDYQYVASHHTYQQLLWQAIRTAQRRNVPHVLYGMSADLQKARFGAIPQHRWAYVQPTETFNAALLTQIAERVGSARS
jgi:7-keto-8-aminopelargonate synthetase-like enzyme